LASSNSFISTSFLLPARGKQGGLVDQIGQIGTGESRRTAGDEAGIDVVAQRHLAHVHLQNLLATANVRQPDHHLPVETTRAQQRRVEHIRTVGGGDHDDAIVALEAIHLDQQLVEGLLALVMTAAQTGATVAADRIDLVDEDDAGRLLLGLLEHVTHRLAPTPTNISTKSEPEMVKNGTLASPAMALASRVLPVPGGPTISTPRGMRPPRRWNLPGSRRNSTSSLTSSLASSHAGHVGKGGLDLVFGEQARLGLAEAHRAATTAPRRPASGA
jgi:hypothetical protein